MNNWVTKFYYSETITSTMTNISIRMLIGFILLFVFLYLLFQLIKEKQLFPKEFVILFILPIICIGWFTVHTIQFVSLLSQLKQIKIAEENNSWDIAEGFIVVIHEQPENGHDQGDIIRVDEYEIEVDYYSSLSDFAFGYTNTISHDGILKSGEYVRLKMLNGIIYQIDLKE